MEASCPDLGLPGSLPTKTRFSICRRSHTNTNHAQAARGRKQAPMAPAPNNRGDDRQAERETAAQQAPLRIPACSSVRAVASGHRATGTAAWATTVGLQLGQEGARRVANIEQMAMNEQLIVQRWKLAIQLHFLKLTIDALPHFFRQRHSRALKVLRWCVGGGQALVVLLEEAAVPCMLLPAALRCLHCQEVRSAPQVPLRPCCKVADCPVSASAEEAHYGCAG